MDRAFFPYGEKSKEFLLKRSLYLCYFLQKQGVDRIILACNTLSLIALPFLKLFIKDISGVFQSFIPMIQQDSAIIGSRTTIAVLKKIMKSQVLIDGTGLIYKIEHNLNYENEILQINEKIKECSNLILACTHFMVLENDAFIIPSIKNKI